MNKTGVECILTETIEGARRGKVVKAKSFEKIIIDTTVMGKAVAYPTDSRLLERGRQHLAKRAGALGITVSQSYNREASRLVVQVELYAHAKQYRRMKATLKALHTVVGRIWRGIGRKQDRQQGEAREPLSKFRRSLLRFACARLRVQQHLVDEWLSGWTG